MEQYGVGPEIVGIIFITGSIGYIITVIIISNYIAPKIDRKLIISLGIIVAVIA